MGREKKKEIRSIDRAGFETRGVIWNILEGGVENKIERKRLRSEYFT